MTDQDNQQALEKLLASTFDELRAAGDGTTREEVTVPYGDWEDTPWL